MFTNNICNTELSTPSKKMLTKKSMNLVHIKNNKLKKKKEMERSWTYGQ